MPNVFKNDEQRQKWYVYNRKYDKAHYRTFTVKLEVDKYATQIEFLRAHRGVMSKAFKDWIATADLTKYL